MIYFIILFVYYVLRVLVYIEMTSAHWNSPAMASKSKAMLIFSHGFEWEYFWKITDGMVLEKIRIRLEQAENVTYLLENASAARASGDLP